MPSPLKQYVILTVYTQFANADAGRGLETHALNENARGRH